MHPKRSRNEQREWRMHLILFFLKKCNKWVHLFSVSDIYLRKILQFTHFKICFSQRLFQSWFRRCFFLTKEYLETFFCIIFDFGNKNNNYLLSILKIGGFNLSFFLCYFQFKPIRPKKHTLKI